jgi:hypothetical protein
MVHLCHGFFFSKHPYFGKLMDQDTKAITKSIREKQEPAKNRRREERRGEEGEEKRGEERRGEEKRGGV